MGPVRGGPPAAQRGRGTVHLDSRRVNHPIAPGPTARAVCTLPPTSAFRIRGRAHRRAEDRMSPEAV